MWHLSPGGGRAWWGGTLVRDHPRHCCGRRGTQGASAGAQRALPCRAPPHTAGHPRFPAAPPARREPVLSRSTLTGAKPSGQRGVRLRLGTPAPQGSSARGHCLPAHVAQHPGDHPRPRERRGGHSGPLGMHMARHRPGLGGTGDRHSGVPGASLGPGAAMGRCPPAH